jgi:hypothetical protein
MAVHSQRTCPVTHRATLCCHSCHHHPLLLAVRPTPHPRTFRRDFRRGGRCRIFVSFLSFEKHLLRPVDAESDIALCRLILIFDSTGCCSPSHTMSTCGTLRRFVLSEARIRQSGSSLRGVSARPSPLSTSPLLCDRDRCSSDKCI